MPAKAVHDAKPSHHVVYLLPINCLFVDLLAKACGTIFLAHGVAAGPSMRQKEREEDDGGWEDQHSCGVPERLAISMCNMQPVSTPCGASDERSTFTS